MKNINRILLAIMAVNTFAFAQTTCKDWYKEMREKYSIVGTKAGIVMDKDGEWQKLFGVGSSAVDFDDPDENEDALEEAEMKAKSVITHFMKEELSSDKMINSISKKMKELSASGEDKQTKKINKKSIKTKTTTIRNSANSLLKGILVFCESIDPVKKQATVIVGVSPKTQRAADSARKGMYGENSATRNNSGNVIVEDRKIKGHFDSSNSLDF